jgi:2-oxoglutarate dehydrogenase E2 component (dihydrolipoamide succinyltransferase)
MSLIEITIPLMGEGIIEATIIRWLVKEGEIVQTDQPIVEIATDKVDSDISAPCSGTVKKIIRKQGEIPKVGELIAVILPEGAEEPEFILVPEIVPKSNKDSQDAESFEENNSELLNDIEQEITIETIPMHDEKAGYLSPYVRKIAEDLRISVEELNLIKGSASSGRITKEDLKHYLELKKDQMQQASTDAPNADSKSFISKEQLYNSEYTIVPMNRMRKIIAEHMSYSIHTAPHVTSFHEADLTNVVTWRDKTKEAFRRNYNTRLTFTPIFMQAMAKAILEFPMINVSLDGTDIIVKKEINIGMATMLPDGNLIVPVIRNADRLNLAGLASAINDLAERAREGKLLPHEIRGGTITLTNLGMFGNLTGIPIINQPESAILAVGSILKKPAVITTKGVPGIAVRDICVLSMSYDHRIIDGAQGGSFLARVASFLENFIPDEKLL